MDKKTLAACGIMGGILAGVMIAFSKDAKLVKGLTFAAIGGLVGGAGGYALGMITPGNKPTA